MMTIHSTAYIVTYKGNVYERRNIGDMACPQWITRDEKHHNQIYGDLYNELEEEFQETFTPHEQSTTI